MPRLSALHSSGARHGVSGCQLRANASRHVTSRLPTCPRALPSDPVATNHTGGATGTSTSPEHLLQEVLDQLKTLNKGTKKLTQQVGCDLHCKVRAECWSGTCPGRDTCMGAIPTAQLQLLFCKSLLLKTVVQLTAIAPFPVADGPFWPLRTGLACNTASPNAIIY